jgi:hypothetical protein
LLRALLPGMASFIRELFKDFSAEEGTRLLSDLKSVYAALNALSQFIPAEPTL